MSTPFDFLEAARELIAAPSVSAMGNDAALAVVRPLAERCGLTTSMLPGEYLGRTHHNLLCAHPGSPGADGGLLLLTHSDTVDPGALEAWTATGNDPYRLTRDGDRLYGLGTADVKLDALCKLLALDRVRELKLTRPVHFLFSFAEEVGLVGARHFMADPPIRHAFASAGEPSELTIIHAHKGYLVIRVQLTDPGAPPLSGARRERTFEGQSAHSSTPHLGDSAIERLLDALHPGPGPAGSHPDEGVARSQGARGLDAAAVRAALGGGVAAVRGGEVANRVADRCTLELDGVGPDGSALLAAAAELRARWCALVAGLEPTEDRRFDPYHSVYNLGRIRLEADEEGRASLDVLYDCRILPGQDAEAAAHAFEREIEAVARAGAFDWSVEVDRDSRALSAPPDGPLIEAAIRAARQVGTDPTPRTKATSTEAGVLASRGAQAMVFGAGVSVGNVHKPNEHNLHSQLLTAIDFYEALIRELCT
ncbi:MAG: M20/M25/M40 family metallo-hydrolase [Deltaproteobacteria bacterium]|nr:M20/M25/M40 family metallo-hydrolase [Deltaproteobacteria bacterium]